MTLRASVTMGPTNAAVEFIIPDHQVKALAFFVAARREKSSGCAIIPYRQHFEGSTVFLPHPVDHLYAVRVTDHDKLELWRREWINAQWSTPSRVRDEFHVIRVGERIHFEFNHTLDPANLHLWTKDLTQNSGWGSLIAPGTTEPVMGDCALGASSFARTHDSNNIHHLSYAEKTAPRVRIYQLLPRLFSNLNERRKPSGTMAENGVGKFAEITDQALASLRDELGVTHLWLTGVHAQATSTLYTDKPADDPDLLKGLAGSPYAIKDYGDVCPDYAVDPSQRLAEFKLLVARIHAAGLRILLDFVPNHVARSHYSQVVEFGRTDNRTAFFTPENNFYWLQPDSPGDGPPLKLPTFRLNESSASTCDVPVGCDGHFDPERIHGRVTGNNAITWSPSEQDWYETVKLNYGFDFTTGYRAFPNAAEPQLRIPDTWEKMDRVLAYWQDFGVDGFRCDMSHMIPPEFWQWAVARARARQPDVYFLAEAYNDDSMKVQGGDPFVAGFGSVMIELLNAGFDAVYDDPAYKALKSIHDGRGWANDLDRALGVRDDRISPDYIFHRSLRYGENHDEVRLASPQHWGGLGMPVGRAVSAILFALSRGPILLYSGQEVGESAIGSEGYCKDNGRTSIFDYWSMPEFTKWVNNHSYDGGRLSSEQRDLRAYYGRLLKLTNEPAFRDGDFIALNPSNLHNAAFGRLPEESISGHWLYAFIRHDSRSRQFCLVIANLHPSQTFSDVRIQLPRSAATALSRRANVPLADPLSALGSATTNDDGMLLAPPIPPLTAGYFGL